MQKASLNSNYADKWSSAAQIITSIPAPRALYISSVCGFDRWPMLDKFHWLEKILENPVFEEGKECQPKSTFSQSCNLIFSH